MSSSLMSSPMGCSQGGPRRLARANTRAHTRMYVGAWTGQQDARLAAMSLTTLWRRWVVRLAAVVAMAFATLFVAPTAAHAAEWHHYGLYPWNQAQQCYYAGY